MTAIVPYRGVYVSAKDANDDIDLGEILSGCAAVESEVSDLSSLTSSLYSSGSKITPEDLSVDGKNVGATLDDCCNGLKNIDELIHSSVSEIRSRAEAAFNNLQQQYNAEAQAEEQAKIRANQAIN